MDASPDEQPSRTQNSVRNLVVGLASRLLQVVLQFVLRFIFIRELGTALLGLNSLLTSLLGVLAMVDLGFGTAVVYSMYRPLRDGDEPRIAALVAYYKKVYTWIGVIVTILGAAFTPFLKIVVNLPEWDDAYYAYYALALAGTASTYFFAHRVALLNADQKMYVVQRATAVATIVRAVIQGAALLLWHSFVAYLVIQIAASLVLNVCLAVDASRRYPFLKRAPQLDSAEKSTIHSNMKYLAVYKIAGAVLTQTDAVLISILVGTLAVGYFSNYLVIITSLNTLLIIIVQAVTAGVGHLNASGDLNAQRGVFFEFLLVTGWAFGFAAVLFVLLANDFVVLWLGPGFTLSTVTVVAIALPFFMVGLQRPVIVYRETTGIFRQTAWMIAVTAVVNIGLSIAFGRVWGMTGILLATPLARLVTNTWYDPVVLFRERFNRSAAAFFARSGLWAATAAAAWAVASLTTSALPAATTWTRWLMKAAVGAVVTLALLLLVSWPLPEFKAVRRRVLRVIRAGR
jgi:O-antigen/teichoic acid export membrane protein